MRSMILAGALAVSATPTLLHAQDGTDCAPRLDETAARVPDLSENPDAHEEMGLSEEQMEAVLATLDAARIVRDADPQGCLNLVEAAASILDSGGE